MEPRGGRYHTGLDLKTNSRTGYAVLANGGYLVTPYFMSNRLVELMKLDDATRERVTLRHFHGGHMFYAWAQSRRALRTDMVEFYREAVAS